MRKLIFLDIDGVLCTGNHMQKLSDNGEKWFKALDPECVSRFNKLVAETGADVVVSSTWRLSHGSHGRLAEELLGKGVVANIIGMTPILHNRNLDATRGDEIAAWIAGNKFDGKFVIIDDDDDMGDLWVFLVQTDFLNGLTDRDCDKIKIVLNE